MISKGSTRAPMCELAGRRAHACERECAHVREPAGGRAAGPAAWTGQAGASLDLITGILGLDLTVGMLATSWDLLTGISGLVGLHWQGLGHLC